ncbi:hypothetical protein [Dyadobacter chenhuakuii]|uniref:Uncharacterized protein n=1 Tax=Dyadobacter chenhuakuii TaxID=2909339 RepID=A0ABY4XIG8_9BACT|nr:hypothetical protein [Dyadobacter chenhuakuii]MCF2496128.1 hypothetical protein [Dyadobacter chenhuakuii]USJ30192.1 hypothetical protein NFI80_20295 [Dyadobacter chenhuakuii]
MLRNIEKRRQELKDAIDSFKEKLLSDGYEFEISDNIVEEVLKTYQMLLTGLHDVHAEGTNLHISKVASGLEISINYMQPIKCSQIAMNIALNAQLALTVAFTFVFSKIIDNLDFKLSGPEEDLLKEHHNWLLLTLSDSPFDYSIICNSLFWKAFLLSVTQRLQLEG